VEFLANVFIGNDIDHYSFQILERDNEQNGSEKQSQTNSARFYELKSNNGIVISSDARIVSMCNLFPRFASLTYLGWSTLAILSKTNSTRGLLTPRSKSTLTLSLPFSSPLMAPSRGLLLGPSMHSPFCPLASRNPWLRTLLSFSQMSQVVSIGTSSKAPSRRSSKS